MHVKAPGLSILFLAAVLVTVVIVVACGGDEKATEAPATAPTAAPAATAAPAPTQAAATEAPSTPVPAAADVGSKVGQVGADFTLTSVDGEEINLNGLRGSPVVLYYFATW
jgi:cytochrome oxidase Cu insertion factor (SCO1/SenC/PrrC family)